uniref:Phosphodiesterase n=1 Tax=Denticeps clupeoides TaxID=299321 RepID=A0AAY4AY84_9TELE
MVIVQLVRELFRFLRGGQPPAPSLERPGAALSNVQVGAYVYLLEMGSGRLLCEDLPHELQQEGELGEALAQNRRLVCGGLPPTVLHVEQRKSLASPLPGTKRVLICPLVDQNDVVGVLLTSCSEEPSEEQERCLAMVEKHIAVACRRVQFLRGPSPDSDRGSYEIDEEIIKLCGDLYDADVIRLQLKIIQHLQKETQSVCCLLLVSDDNHRVFCQVVGGKVLEEDMSFPLDNGHFGKALKEKKPIGLQDLSTHEQGWLKSLMGLEVEQMLCVPVVCRGTGQVVALACAFNKTGSYTVGDGHVMQRCFHYTSPLLSSALACCRERKLKAECQALLHVAKNLFTHLDDVSGLLKEIISEARKLSNAESCSVFLLDKENKELVAKVFDGGMVMGEEILGMRETPLNVSHMELRIPVDQGIAGHVATTGEILNIKDAYTHPLFYRAVDERTGFRTRNILCFPIKDVSGVIVGVAELVNKLDGPWFNRFDEDLAIAFSIYCGISIAHSLLYKQACEAQFRSTLANEMMRYHMKVSDEEVARLLAGGIPSVDQIHPCFSEITYIPRSLTDAETTTAVLSMFEAMGFINAYKINRNTLARFCLMVKKGYRDPPYHNWMHAFSVAHFCFLLCKNVDVANYLEDIEMLALFVSCLCHDLDHRGTNNSFQIESKSVLAGLYSSQGSVLERHHFAQTISVLNTEGCNIFEQFSRKDYQRMLDLMCDIILATDLAHHLRILGDIQKMVTEGYDFKKPQHHTLLLCLLMSSCDLSDQTKDWRNTCKVAELIYREFFSQGDSEKAMGNRPSDMMDRDRAYIPDLQISFMEHIVVPIFTVLKGLFPPLAVLHETISSSQSRWKRISQKYRDQGFPGNGSLEFLEKEM